MRFCPAVFSLMAALAGSPLAQNQGNPSRISLGDQGIPGVKGTFSALSLQPGEFVMGIATQGHRDPSLLTIRPRTESEGQSPEEATILAARVSLAVGLGRGIDAGLVLPMYFESLSGASSGFSRGRGAGDPALTLKALLPWKPPHLRFALQAIGSLPLASESGLFPRALIHHPPERAYPSLSTTPYGTLYPRLGAGAGVTLAFGTGGEEAYRFHFNLKSERTMAPEAESPLGVVGYSLAAEVSLGPLWRLKGEYQKEELFANPMAPSTSYAEGSTFTLGVTLVPVDWLSVSAGGILGPEALNPRREIQVDGRAIAYRSNAQAAAWIAFALQGYPLRWDRDRDGIPDRRDRCPRRAEDLDGFEDGDGCPEIDNDRDGFTDTLDRCPDSVEDRDGFQDWDGCPDPDNDLDGLPDGRDQCRNEAEDPDGFQDEDGCPDLDNDRDGIMDGLDKCPTVPENKNRFEDSDGCPEPDSDRDGMPDKLDRCPQEAEIVNFFHDEDGCPDEKPEPVRNAPLPGVAFLTGSAEFLPASFRSLDSLAALLQMYPGTEIEIQGHLDDRAGSGALGLSEDQAKAVAAYLAKKGIERWRLKPVGFGGSRPVTSNRTARGRETNRRIEIRRLN